jgi:DNA-binding MarR family transcriptional regulator
MNAKVRLFASTQSKTTLPDRCRSTTCRYIRIDRSTLGELITRMEGRSLVMRQSNGSDCRLAKVSLTVSGKDTLFGLVSGARGFKASWSRC